MFAARRGMRGVMVTGVAGAILAAGCMGNSKKPVPEPLPISLEIQNHAFADMDVYAVPSASGSGSVRLITVSGFSTAKLLVRRAQLQPGSVLQVELHGIGTRTRWLSPALSVSPGERVMLEINSDANGYLGRTILYPLPTLDSLDTMPAVRGPASY